MKKASAVLLGIAAFAAIPASGDESKGVGGSLTGYQEVPTLSTTGNGRFDALIDERRDEVHWRLSYGQLEGTVLQAHIHLGRPAINGGISVFLCTNIGNAPPAPAQPTQACPVPTGSETVTISGTFTPADVVGGATAQGLAPGEFDELVRAIRAGATYANVHSSTRTGGEIRAQIERGHGHDGHDHD
jgi:hypothetical protein